MSDTPAGQVEAIPQSELAPSAPGVAASPADAVCETLDCHGVARALGVSLSKVRQLDREGMLPEAVRLGKNLRWSRRKLSAWLDHNCPPRLEWEARWRQIISTQ